MVRFLACLLFFGVVAAGCSRPETPATSFRWWAGREAPAFDPQGPPDALRASLERLLTRPLIGRDSLGRPVPDAAARIDVSPDGLRYTFHLERGLAFTDGTPCRSAVFRDALLAAVARTDHGTARWALAALRGMEAVRPRRPLPALGIDAPDDSTLVLQLVVPDSLLLARLAVPGLTAVWAGPASDWKEAVGLGPWRVLAAGERSLTLLPSEGRPDTIAIRFGAGAARARAALRGREFDLMWPLPPALLDQALPAGWALHDRPARPPRRLSLVMRADVPPTTRLAARRVLAHGIARAELPRRLGRGAREVGEWLPGAGPAELPGLDQAQLADWLERGKLGRSVHVTLAYDADGAGGAIARSLQGDWARYGLYIDLLPLRGPAFAQQALSGQAQALLVEEQGLVEGPAGLLATLVMPLRGPAVGGWRTGWRTREFDAAILPGRSSDVPDLRLVKQRIEDETVVVPLAALDWVWLQREGGQATRFDPVHGPGPPVRSVP